MEVGRESRKLRVIGLLWFVLAILIWPFRSNAQLKAENAVLRQQLLVLRG